MRKLFKRGKVDNATQYNFLNHQDVKDLENALKGCASTGDVASCEKSVRNQFAGRSAANIERLNNCTANCAAIRQEILDGQKALAEVKGLTENSQNIIDLMGSNQTSHLSAADSKIAILKNNRRVNEQKQEQERELIAISQDPERLEWLIK